MPCYSGVNDASIKFWWTATLRDEFERTYRVLGYVKRAAALKDLIAEFCDSYDRGEFPIDNDAGDESVSVGDFGSNEPRIECKTDLPSQLKLRFVSTCEGIEVDGAVVLRALIQGFIAEVAALPLLRTPDGTLHVCKVRRGRPAA